MCEACPAPHAGWVSRGHQVFASELLKFLQIQGRLGSERSGVTSSSGGRGDSGYQPLEAAETDPLLHPARVSDLVSRAESGKRWCFPSCCSDILLCGMGMGTTVLLPWVTLKCHEAYNRCHNIHLHIPLHPSFTLTVAHRCCKPGWS